MNKSAVIFGAGNVGRGFLGQLFSESGYEVVFVDIDQLLIDAINAINSYKIRLVDNDVTEEVVVSPAKAINSKEVGQVAKALEGASISVTSVGARVLPMIAPLVAAGISQRAKNGVTKALNIIVCENLKNAASTFRNMVNGFITESEKGYFKDKIGFVDTVIGRMVPPPTAEMRNEDPSLIAVEPYKELPVDRLGFMGEIPSIVGMEVCDNFPAYTARKLYIHNCGHALLAYLGYLRGYEYGYEALVDEVIRPIFNKGLIESKLGIVAEYHVKTEWLEKHIEDLTHRFANKKLGDTIFRLGRDPLRKLSPNDRLIGAARLAEKAGVKPEALSWGIAAGFMFDASEDPMTVTMQERIKLEGLDAVMADISGLHPGEALSNMVKERYALLHQGK